MGLGYANSLIRHTNSYPSTRPDRVISASLTLYLENSTVLARSRALLLSGRSVGIFPEAGSTVTAINC